MLQLLTLRLGSSPRERGKLEDITGVRMVTRLIPA